MVVLAMIKELLLLLPRRLDASMVVLAMIKELLLLLP